MARATTDATRTPLFRRNMLKTLPGRGKSLETSGGLLIDPATGGSVTRWSEVRERTKPAPSAGSARFLPSTPTGEPLPLTPNDRNLELLVSASRSDWVLDQ